MKVNLSITTGKDDKEQAPAIDYSAARRELEDAWSKATEPDLAPEESNRRLAWVGGAIKIYALISGESPESIQNSLSSSVSPTTQPTVPSRYAALIPAVAPSTSRRPPKHPGAQRPVAPEIGPEQGEEDPFKDLK